MCDVHNRFTHVYANNILIEKMKLWYNSDTNPVCVCVYNIVGVLI